MEAVLMCRVSDPKQEDKYSLDAQDREGKEYAERKQFTLRAEKFVFQETASKPQQRKKFDEIIALIYERTKGKGSRIALLVEKHDRLLRNHANAVQVLALVEAGRLEVHFFRTGKVLDKSSDPSEFLVNDVMTSVNTFQARTIGREAIKGMTEKAQQGWLPNKAPLGYLNVDREIVGKRSGRDTTESIIVPNPDHRLVVWVLRMFQLADEGASIREIRRRCIDEGVVPAERIARFSKTLIESTLKNPFYGGTILWREVEYEGQHELIIPKELFARVHARAAGDTRRKRKHDGALVGWLKCGDCGCQITYEPKTKPSGLRFDYYRCSNGKGFHQKSQYVAEAVILSRFEPMLETITITDKKAKQVSDALSVAHFKVQAAKQRQMEGFRAGLKELEGAEDELYPDFKKGLLDDETFKRQLARIRSERQRFTTLLEHAQQAVDGAYLKTAQVTLELATRAKSLWDSRTAVERRQFLEKLLSNPLLDGATVRYEMKKPFRLIASMNQNGDLLPETLPGSNFESSFVLARPPAKPKRPVLLGPPQVVATLTLAEGFQRQMELGLVKHLAELADAQDMVRPRVTQIMKLLKLPSPVLAYVKGLGPGLRPFDVTERKLVRLLPLSPAQQLVEARRSLPGFSEFVESSGRATATLP